MSKRLAAGRFALALGALVLASSCSRPAEDARPGASATPAATAQLSAQIRFTTLWWSESQMEGLDPNNPPPKNTRVELKHWEYTDPIGVPHPDIVDAIVTLRNTGQRSTNPVTLKVDATWRVGPRGNPAEAQWEPPTTLSTESGFSLNPGATRELRVPIDLKTKMDALHAQDRWPFALRLSALEGERTLTQTDFEIQPGD